MAEISVDSGGGEGKKYWTRYGLQAAQAYYIGNNDTPGKTHDGPGDYDATEVQP